MAHGIVYDEELIALHEFNWNSVQQEESIAEAPPSVH